MEERKIYQLTSGEGYVVVVNENFVTLRCSGSSVYTSVRAFLADDNGQSQRFDDVAEAVTPGPPLPPKAMWGSPGNVPRSSTGKAVSVIPSPSNGGIPGSSGQTFPPCGPIPTTTHT